MDPIASGRIDQFQRAIAIQRAFAFGTAAGSRAGGEDERIVVPDARGDVLVRFEIADQRAHAKRSQLVRMIRITDQPRNGVATREKKRVEMSRDLAMRTDDNDVHYAPMRLAAMAVL
jgi:hypothetical protein